MQDDVKINVVTLEDGKEYYEIKKILLNDNEYLILSAVEEENFAIRKLVKVEEQEDLFISKLDSEEEVQKVLKTFLDSFNIQ